MVFVSYLQILFYNTTKLIWVMFNLLIVYFAQIEILWLSLQSEVQTEVRRLQTLAASLDNNFVDVLFMSLTNAHKSIVIVIYHKTHLLLIIATRFWNNFIADLSCQKTLHLKYFKLQMFK